ncbi:HET-domain-containing protein [Stipitochalara longipes BDJ]|nr:HET-domain-containing protein [Stipitochalara longipes BDJ]
MGPPQDVSSFTPEPDNALFSAQLESLMRHEFIGDVPVVGSLDDLEALMKHEFFAEPDPEPTKSFYKSLLGKDEIRLLCLEPGNSAGLKGKLVHVRLADKPTYEALSYAWGPPVKTYEIALPNGILRITESLFSSLMHLRRRGRERLLWIDQLCINQDDDTEKIQQILLMRQIYSSATRVLVWLGPDEGNGSIALRLLEQIGKLETNNLHERAVSASWMAANGLPPRGDRAWFSLLNFWRRRWFRRAWVVQEFVLAKEALMICGKTQLSWQALISGHEKMFQYALLDWGTYDDPNIEDEKNEAWSGTLSLRVMLDTKNSTKVGSTISNIVRSFSERDETGLEELQIGSWGKFPGVKELVMQLREIPEATGPVTQWLSQFIDSFTPEDNKIRLPLCDLLQLYGKSEATDPRDRLFAFLGLAIDGDENALRPNYDESVESIFLRYANHFVRSGNGIKVLHQSSGLSNRTLSLPTWVPDWTQSELFENRPANQIASTGLFYKAAADTTPKVRCTENENEIVTSAVHVGIISRTSVNHPGNPPSSEDWFFKLEHYFEEVDTFILNRGSYVTGEPLFDVQWKTLIGNSSNDTGFGAPEEYGQQYHVCRNIIGTLNLEKPIPRADEMNGYFKRLFMFMITYKVCETDTGYVGMVPIDTEVGNSVYIFAGGPLPFILRPNKEVQSKYQVVGGCYIHGVMKGELVNSGRWEEEDIILQ